MALGTRLTSQDTAFSSQEFAVSHCSKSDVIKNDALELLVRRYARIMPIVFVNVFQVAMP